DGIRDDLVTGVQTCALPILAGIAAQLVECCVTKPLEIGPESGQQLGKLGDRQREFIDRVCECDEYRVIGVATIRCVELFLPAIRSEERRVGNECTARGATDV